MADFAFATCLPEIEPAVKREVARTRPELRFAYSRPGLLTFRSSGVVTADDAPGSVFARVWGRSLGAVASPAEAADRLAGLGVQRAHVFAREEAEEVAAEWQVLGPGGAASEGEVVADVVVAAAEVWLGVHRHDGSRSPHAGGAFPVEVPADAPSRAFAKIEEAIAWKRLPVGAGQVAVEIGAAPGGALMALARRGVEAWGVDPGALAPQVLALPGVHHIAKKVGALRWEELPGRVDWLLVDMNLAPQVVLHEIARLMPRLRPTLRGAVVTLKMNEWAFVDELPRFAARLAELGLPRVSMRHLPSNRREVCAVALC